MRAIRALPLSAFGVQRQINELARLEQENGYLKTVIGSQLSDRCKIQGLTPGDVVKYAADEIEKLRERQHPSPAARRLADAARALKLDEAMTFEGNLEAHAYFSVDALNEMRSALAEVEGER